MNRLSILAVPLFSAGLLLPFACTQDFSVFEGLGPGGSGATTGPGTTSGATTNPVVGCKSAADCDDHNPCTSDECTVSTGLCTHGLLDGAVAGLPESPQPCAEYTCVAGVDTLVNLAQGVTCGTNKTCDGAGVCGGCSTDADCPTPSSDCTTVTCSGTGTCVTRNVAVSKACSSNQGTVCDGRGLCVACVTATDCTSAATPACVANKCVSQCADTKLNGDETDVDCGGSCSKCANGKGCLVAADCTSGTCTNLICAPPPPPPSCTDNLKNQDETGIDCGGATCPKCDLGQGCSAAADCKSTLVCTFGLCAQTPPATCFNQTKDSNETGVDCGGQVCPKRCLFGEACGSNFDCASNNCKASVCALALPPECTNGVLDDNTPKDGGPTIGETDVDCGGPTCTARCAQGKTCLLNADCASVACVVGKCVPPAPLACSNSQKDAITGETDVDCGGPTCPTRCTVGKGCAVNTDCESNNCDAGSLLCLL